MAGSTSLVSAEAGFTTGYNFSAQMARLTAARNVLPGLFESEDFTVTQRAAGANMSVDVSSGRAVVDPRQAAYQGAYTVRSAFTYNTLANGGYTWAAAHASDPRIDLLCIEVKDTELDASGLTGWRFRIVDGTANASATHQLNVAYWPAIPTGCVPIAAIRIPAAGTTITTANITNLNPVGGGNRFPTSYTSTTETTASTTYTRLTTPDFMLVYVPNNRAEVRVGYRGHWSISVASGTQGITAFINGTQLKAPANSGAPTNTELTLTLATLFSHVCSYNASSGGFASIAGSGSNVTDTGGNMLHGAGTGTVYHSGPMTLTNLNAGWYLIEVQYKTSANTLSVRERRMWAEVIS